MPSTQRGQPRVGRWFSPEGLRKASPRAIVARLRRDIQRFGVTRTAYAAAMTAINVCVDVRIVRVLKVEATTPAFLEGYETFCWRFLERDELLEMARDPEGPLNEPFVRTALDKGDECFGGFDGDQLACYAWYSNQPTDDQGLTFHFPADYVYSYSGATHPEYRGLKLIGVAFTRAFTQFLDRGFRGVTFAVDSHNYAVMRSAAQVAAQEVGRILVFKLGRLAWMHASRGCRQHGFYLTKPTD